MSQCTCFALLRHYDHIAGKVNISDHTSPLVARGALLFSSSSISRLAGFSPAQGQSTKIAHNYALKNNNEPPVKNKNVVVSEY